MFRLAIIIIVISITLSPSTGNTGQSQEERAYDSKQKSEPIIFLLPAISKDNPEKVSSFKKIIKLKAGQTLLTDGVVHSKQGGNEVILTITYPPLAIDPGFDCKLQGRPDAFYCVTGGCKGSCVMRSVPLPRGVGYHCVCE